MSKQQDSPICSQSWVTSSSTSEDPVSGWICSAEHTGELTGTLSHRWDGSASLPMEQTTAFQQNSHSTASLTCRCTSVHIHLCTCTLYTIKYVHIEIQIQELSNLKRIFVLACLLRTGPHCKDSNSIYHLEIHLCLLLWCLHAWVC